MASFGFASEFEPRQVRPLRGGELLDFAQFLRLPILRQLQLFDGVSRRLDNDVLHRLGRGRHEARHRRDEAGLHGLRERRRLAPLVELRPDAGRARFERASLPLRRREKQLFLRRKKSARRVPVEKIAEPAPERLRPWPLPLLAQVRRIGFKVAQPARRRSGARSRGARRDKGARFAILFDATLPHRIAPNAIPPRLSKP